MAKDSSGRRTNAYVATIRVNFNEVDDDAAAEFAESLVESIEDDPSNLDVGSVVLKEVTRASGVDSEDEDSPDYDSDDDITSDSEETSL
jgi:hypothetical protein